MKNNKRILFAIWPLLALLISGCSNNSISNNDVSSDNNSPSSIKSNSNQGSQSLNSGGQSNPSSTHKHTYSSEWSYDEEYHWHDATCGHNLQSSRSKHDFGEWIVDVDPTIKENGHQYKTCSVCGYRVNEMVPATGTL